MVTFGAFSALALQKPHFCPGPAVRLFSVMVLRPTLLAAKPLTSSSWFEWSPTSQAGLLQEIDLADPVLLSTASRGAKLLARRFGTKHAMTLLASPAVRRAYTLPRFVRFSHKA